MQCLTCHLEFSLTDSDRTFLARFAVPEPVECPSCRQQRRLAFRNERTLYKRVCDLCHKGIISLYPPETVFPVYCSDCWWSDKWDALSFGRDYFFERSFFDQFHELMKKVPRVGILTRNAQNSEYTNCEEDSKNCYLCFAGAFSEDCMYCYFEITCRDCVDCSLVDRCELCYECLNLENCYHCMYLLDSKDCSNCFLGSDLIGCHDCFGCIGLRNKQYHIFNKAYEKSEYERQIKELFPRMRSAEILKEFQDLKNTMPYKYAHILNSEDCSGDYIENSQNCELCYDVKRGKDSRYILFGDDFKDCYDSDVVYIPAELVYNSQSVCLAVFDVKCCDFCWSIKFSSYCDSCHYSNNLFGCIGLKHKEYCVLNKQYSKADY